MRKSIYYRMLLISGVCLFGLSSPITASAQCVTPPTCSELGYTKTASECSGHTFLKCPFNTAVGYCDLGTSSGGTTISCPTGYFLYNDIYPTCNAPNQTELIQYSYSSGDPIEYKDEKYKNCYKCKKCTEGYWIEAGSCFSSYSSTDTSGCKYCKEGGCVSGLATWTNGRCIGS